MYPISLRFFIAVFTNSPILSSVDGNNIFVGNDYYLTVTESKRRVDKDGRFVYDKHKIFLYKEDFEKFTEGLEEVIKFIKEKCPVVERVYEGEEKANNFSDVDFDQL